MTYEDAEKIYDSLDDERKRLVGVFGMFAAGHFVDELVRIVFHLFSGNPDDNK